MDVEEASNADSRVLLLEANLRVHEMSENPLGIELVGSSLAAGAVRVERDRVDVLELSRVGDLFQKIHVRRVEWTIRRRVVRKTQRSSVPGHRVDPGIRTLSGLELHLMGEEIVKVIAIGAGYENHAVPLIESMILDVLEDPGLNGLPDDPPVLTREFHPLPSSVVRAKMGLYYDN